MQTWDVRARSAGPALVATLILASVLVAAAPSAAASNSTFSVISATWAASAEVGPGSTDVPLTLAIDYTGGTTANYVYGQLQLPAGFTATSGTNTPTSGVGSTAANSIFRLTYNLTISGTASVGSYSIPVVFAWSTSSTGSQGVNAETDTATVNLLGTVQMSATASLSTLNAGEVNNVTITLTNRGTGTATRINPTVSASAGSVLTTLPQVTSLAGGASVSLPIQVYVPSTSAGQAVTLTLAASYLDAYGSSGSASLAVGFYAVTVPEPVLTFQAVSESLTPGQVSDVLVTLTNSGPGAVTALKTTVTAPSGFSVLNQFPQVQSLQVGQSLNATLRIFAPTSSAGTAATFTFSVAYTDAYGYSQTSTQTVGLYTASSAAVSAAISLSVTSTNNSLVAGEKSPVVFVIRNTGQQPVYAPTISLTTSSPLIVSVNSTVTLAGATITPGGAIVYTAGVTTGTSATGGFYSGNLAITFNDQFGDSHTQTFPVGFVVAVPITRVSVTSVVSQIGVGTTSQVSFMITNSGTAPIYSPMLSLTVPSGLAVTSNATFSRSGLMLGPGKSLKYVANVSDGPKTTEGAYIATLTVGFSDEYGNIQSTSFSVGLVAVGAIQMVVQNEVVSQSGATVSVAGTLLNEGLANAYYTQVTAVLSSGNLQIANASSYVGEVDSNTPLPIAVTLTVPSGAATSGRGGFTLTLIAAYQNDFGQALRYKTAEPVQLTGSSSSGKTSGDANSNQGIVSAGTLELIRYASLGGILLAAVVTVVYIRRSRSRGKKATPQKSDVY